MLPSTGGGGEFNPQHEKTTRGLILNVETATLREKRRNHQENETIINISAMDSCSCDLEVQE